MTRGTIAMILATLGTLFFLAIAFDLLPDNVGTFAALACYIASGLAWSLPLLRRK